MSDNSPMTKEKFCSLEREDQIALTSCGMMAKDVMEYSPILGDIPMMETFTPDGHPLPPKVEE